MTKKAHMKFKCAVVFLY